MNAVLAAVFLLLVVSATVLWPSPARRPPGSPARPASSARVRMPRRDRVRLQAELADTIALLIGPLHRGVPPATALRVAIDAVDVSRPLSQSFEHLLEAAARGEALAEVWLREADALDSADLRFVGQAWRLTERTGAPLARALESAEEVLRERQVSRERLAAMTAGPRASMVVLTVLPLCGPLVGAVFGFGPGDLYLSSPVALASLVIGLVMALFGWLVSRIIIERALRPAVSSGAGAP
ncbi:type II secretion system F family protein [Nostocoides sp. HKS02]|uniref:type II secretion system F family protein n=1 Tax=Nostocoides sp. HKS02 TaxID=1813880 RepID=UPI0012B482E7|nr:type II secretion system F family protein [Tetrasphaera sp. HKS02]QGN58424.1 hypothetical protein GKE56_11620 [Tetrasphaera sp. HKS02]